MRKRNELGGTTAFVIVSTLVLIATGLAFFYLMKMFAGHSELQNAADAGTLAVAKTGIETPTVQLPAYKAGGKRSPFEGLIDAHTGGFNLQSYNRAVGQAFLVALNAEADGKDTGIQNAKNLIQSLQGANGIGSQLADKLSNPGSASDSWALSSFTSPASSNSLRMLDSNNSAAPLNYNLDSDSYHISYVRPKKADLASSNSNIELNDNFKAQIPFKDYQNDKRVSLPANSTAKDSTHNYKSLRGYDPIKIGRVGSICAVTMSPFEQPHLESNKHFADSEISPATNVGLVVPPNAFQTTVVSRDQRSTLALKVQASSAVGTAAINYPIEAGSKNINQLSAAMPKYGIAIPRGYLIIDNMGDGQDSSYVGIVPQMNTKAEIFYHTANGVSVDDVSGCFSNGGQVESWMAYNYNLLHGGPALVQPSLAGLYDGSGHPATIAQAVTITPEKTPSPCHCNDLTSDSSDPGVIPICAQYITSTPYHPGPFDTAYHPQYLNPPIKGIPGAQLTAAELAKMNLWEDYLWSLMGKVIVIDRTTGARMYPVGDHDPLATLPGFPPANLGTPYNAKPGSPLTLGVNVSKEALEYSDAAVPGRVSSGGSILSLMTQLSLHSMTPLAVKEMRSFLENRMWQIKPDASQAEIDAVITLLPIEVHQKYFLYLDKDRKFTLSTTPPFWVDQNDYSQVTADGHVHPYNSLPFNLVGTLVNSEADFNIHTKPFLDDSKALLLGQLKASFTPSSGANNLLGVIRFSERAWGGGLFANAN